MFPSRIYFSIQQLRTCFNIIREDQFSKFTFNKYSLCKRSVNISAYFQNEVNIANDQFSDGFFDSVDYDYLSKGDENILKKLKVIVLEVDVMRQSGERVPTKIKTEQWSELLHLPSRNQRVKLLSFLAQKEKIKEKDKRKRAEKKFLSEEIRKVKLEELKNNHHIHYGFGGSTIFLRVYDTKIDDFHNSKLIRAMRFGQDLIYDCGYDNYMTNPEASNCAKQLGVVFSENRLSDEPFNIHLVNAKKDSKVMSKLFKVIPTLYNPDFPLNISEKHYLDLFPKERLVYLTPHCKNDLTEFNYDDIYIVGALVDKGVCEPLSMAKAKKEGLRMAKFPLDRYLNWHLGSKSLTINQVGSILLHLKSFPKDWETALKHVPKRKIKEGEEPQLFTRLRARREYETKFSSQKRNVKWRGLFKDN